MKSMTGFGAGVAELDGKKVTIELKAVNNRFLEINVRLFEMIDFYTADYYVIYVQVIENGRVLVQMAVVVTVV